MFLATIHVGVFLPLVVMLICEVEAPDEAKAGPTPGQRASGAHHKPDDSAPIVPGEEIAEQEDQG
jgi:hypothetical protein